MKKILCILLCLILLTGCARKEYLDKVVYSDYNHVLHVGRCSECRYGTMQVITILTVIDAGDQMKCRHDPKQEYDMISQCDIQTMQRCASCGYVAWKMDRKEISCLLCYSFLHEDELSIHSFEVQ